MCAAVMENDGDVLGFPAEPEGFFQPDPQPSVVEYTRPRTGDVLRLGLVAKHPLWANHLWNGGRVLADMIERADDLLPPVDVRGKRVVEFGAGAALPSIVALLNGAASVTVCEFPEEPLLQNIRANVASAAALPSATAVRVCGFLWGADPTPLGGPFDVALLADLLANHSALKGLAQSVAATLARPAGVAYVAFGHHRPWLADRDLEFFAHASAAGLRDEEVCTLRAAPMFPDDPGDSAVRATVHVHKLTWMQQ